MRAYLCSDVSDYKAYICSACAEDAIISKYSPKVCPACGYVYYDERVQYSWHTKHKGYTRLIPTDEYKSVKTSITAAKKRGVRFRVRETFAGFSIKILSHPIQKT